MKLCAAALAVVLLAGCAKWSPPIDQSTTHGPTARQFWILHQAMSNSREPSIDERRHWEDQLDIRIEQYLHQHPEDASALHVTTFRYAKQVVTGMSKEQVLILLGAPDGVTSDQAVMEKAARRYWKDMQGNVTEAWQYPLGWTMFFAGQRLMYITQYLERD